MGNRGMTHTYRSKELKLNIVKEALGGKVQKKLEEKQASTTVLFTRG